MTPGVSGKLWFVTGPVGILMRDGDEDDEDEGSSCCERVRRRRSSPEVDAAADADADVDVESAVGVFAADSAVIAVGVLS